MRLKTGIFGLFLLLALNVCPFSGAYANPIAAGGFIEAMAAAAGISAGDFVASTAGIIAVGSGMNIAYNDAGIRLGQDLSNSLANLGDAANYPAWDTLSNDEKASYGNDSTNYDAAKFNSLMTAFGLGDAANRYYGFTASGGGNWEADWTEEELSKLQEIGNIGKNWIQGVPNKVDSCVEAITNRTFLASYFPPIRYTYTKSENDTDWPSYIPESLSWETRNAFTCSMNGNNYDVVNLYGKSTVPVNTIFFQGTRTDNGAIYGTVYWFSESPFGAWINRESNADVSGNTASQVTANGVTFYKKVYGDYWLSMSLTPNQVNKGFITDSDANTVISYILGGTPEQSGGADMIEEYPADISKEGQTETYYPTKGINNISTWLDFVEPQTPATGDLKEVIALLRQISNDIGLLDRTSEDLTNLENMLGQFQFYANGILKVHDEGILDQLTDTNTLLEQILAKTGLETGADDLIGDFDFPELQTKADGLADDIANLAPFGSVLLISETVAIVSQTGNIEKPELIVPFNFMPGQQYEVDLDLSWLDPLKPVINALLITVLVLTLSGVSLKFVQLEASS